LWRAEEGVKSLKMLRKNKKKKIMEKRVQIIDIEEH